MATPMTTDASEDDQAHHRVLQIDRLARRLDGGDERQFDRANQRVRRLDLVEIAAEGPQHQVGKHDRQPDRHHGLAQILSLDAAKDEDLHGDADQRDDDEGGDEAQHPGSGRDADRIADIAAEQIKRAVREIDVAHQPEDQGEAARHQEIQAAERDAVENGAEEHLLPAEGVLQTRRPGRKDQPQHCRDRDQDDKCPQRMAFDEFCHATPPAFRQGLGREQAAGLRRRCATMGWNIRRHVGPCPPLARRSFAVRSRAYPIGPRGRGLDRQYPFARRLAPVRPAAPWRRADNPSAPCRHCRRKNA